MSSLPHSKPRPCNPENMENQHTSLLSDSSEGTMRRMLASVTASVAMSFLILFAIVQAQKVDISQEEPVYEDLYTVVIPSPPPPPPQQESINIPPPPSFLNFESSPTDSTIQIAYAPKLTVATFRPVVQPFFDFTLESFKPSHLALNDRRLVYTKRDVDQPPIAIYKKVPKISPKLFASVDLPRVALMYIVNTDGSVEAVNILGSASEEFDQGIIDAVKKWRFKPAVKDGNNVRCWIKQGISIRMGDRNRFKI